MDSTEKRVSRSGTAPATGTAKGRSGETGGSRSSDEIRQDIRRTRSRIDRRVDELQETVEPRRLMRDGVEHLKSDLLPAAGRMARRHPIPIALLGVGTTWMVLDLVRNARSDDEIEIEVHSVGGDASRGGLRGRVGRVKDNVKDKVKSAASRGASQVRDGARAARDETSGRLRGAGRAVRRGGRAVQERGREAAHGSRRLFDDNPLAVGAAALAAGLVMGISIPSSRWEDRHLGEASEKVTEKLKTKARAARDTAVERGREAASAAVGAAQEELVDGEPGSQATADAESSRASTRTSTGSSRAGSTKTASAPRRPATPRRAG